MEIKDVRSKQIQAPGGGKPPQKAKKPQEADVPKDEVSIGRKGQKDDDLIKINVLSMNDLHGAIDPMLDPKVSKDSHVGGMEYGKAVLDKEKAKNPEGTLTLNAGDLAEGTMISYISKGKAATEGINNMGFDAVALGNHDFAWGQDALQTMVQGLDAPILAANVVKEKDGTVMDGAQPYMIKDLKGVKVGVIGLDTPSITHFVDKKKLKGLKFEGAAETVKKWMPEVKKKGADVIMVLSHIGFEEDKKLAREVDGIDVIVGGHSHTELKEGHREGDTTIVQAGALGKFVGNLEIGIDPKTKKIKQTRAKLIPVIADRIEPDPKIQEILKPYRAEAEEFGAHVVGHASEDLMYAHREAAKLNQIHADSMLEYTDADFGICNSRTLRGNIPAGPITYKDAYSALPFTEENCVTVKATGRQCLQEIEDDLRDDATELAVPTGCKYVYDPTLPEGERVLRFTFPDGKPIELDKEYTVAMNETMSRKKFFGEDGEAKGKIVHSGAQPVFFDKLGSKDGWKNDPDDRVKAISLQEMEQAQIATG